MLMPRRGAAVEIKNLRKEYADDTALGKRYWAALGTTGDPRDLCGALVYLASDAGKWTSGQCLNVDGGWIMRL